MDLLIPTKQKISTCTTVWRPLYRSTCVGQLYWKILLERSFTTCTLLLTAYSAFVLARRRRSSPQRFVVSASTRIILNNICFLLHPVGVGSNAISVSVYTRLCARLHVSNIARPNFTKFSVHVTCVRGLVLLWRQRNTLCTSGFVDDVMFAHKRPGRGDASRAYTRSTHQGAKYDAYDCLVE